MELWIPVFFMCSQVSWVILVIAFGLDVWANKGGFVLAPRGSPLGRILADRLEHVLPLSSVQGGID